MRATLPFMRAGDVRRCRRRRARSSSTTSSAPFPTRQAGGTRLVLTQSTYLLQKWIDRLDDGDRIIATADRAALERCAPEALQARGPLEQLRDRRSRAGLRPATSRTQTSSDPVSSVPRARSPSCSRARSPSSDPSRASASVPRGRRARPGSCEVAQLALASACRENRDGGAARDGARSRRGARAGLGGGRTTRAASCRWSTTTCRARATAFQRAADLMPAFSAAFSNLGATLGELGDPAAALDGVPAGAGARSAQLHHPQQHRRRLPRAGTARRIGGGVPPRHRAQPRRSCSATTTSGTRCSWRGRYADALARLRRGTAARPAAEPAAGLPPGDRAASPTATSPAPSAIFWRFANAAPAGRARGSAARSLRDRARAADAASRRSAPQRPFLDRLGAEIAKSE